ncbi:DUF6286 domain-containing protein [Quadrisphaera setariae]|uniref:DUF6286 domain-containing protein n=1 Tax=Quadrisphaera setariae TaxID=2593304 RepID=UPI00164FA9D6|nr:DUF6286 domain-containing protein [Quadrisphaera setariae]
MSADPTTPTTTGPAPLRAAAARTGAGPIGWVGPLLALLLALIGLVLLRDGVFAPRGGTGWPGGQQSWLTSATTPVDGLTRAPWVVAAGVALVLLGLALLVVALRRRTRRVLALAGCSGAHLLPADVARRARAAAEDVDGVLDASASATRRTVVVEVTTTGGASGGGGGDVRARVASAVAGSLAALTAPPRVRVHAATGGPQRSGRTS